MEKKFRTDTARPIRTFDKLQVSKNYIPKLDLNLVVVNLLNRQLSSKERSVLEKGRNFAVTPNFVPDEYIIANVESAIQHLEINTAEEVPRETSILPKAKHPKGNEKSLLRNLNNDKDIIPDSS